MKQDNWKHRSKGMVCATCMYYARKNIAGQDGQEKPSGLGRCRRNAPTMKGWPVMFESDWCGEHKLDETSLS